MLIISSYLPVYNVGQEIKWVNAGFESNKDQKYKMNYNKRSLMVLSKIAIAGSRGLSTF